MKSAGNTIGGGNQIFHNAVGIALLHADRPARDADVLERADRAMYQVKHGTKGGVALIDE